MPMSLVNNASNDARNNTGNHRKRSNEPKSSDFILRHHPHHQQLSIQSKSREQATSSTNLATSTTLGLIIVHTNTDQEVEAEKQEVQIKPQRLWPRHQPRKTTMYRAGKRFSMPSQCEQKAQTAKADKHEGKTQQQQQQQQAQDANNNIENERKSNSKNIQTIIVRNESNQHKHQTSQQPKQQLKMNEKPIASQLLSKQ